MALDDILSTKGCKRDPYSETEYNSHYTYYSEWLVGWLWDGLEIPQQTLFSIIIPRGLYRRQFQRGSLRILIQKMNTFINLYRRGIGPADGL